MPLWVKGPYFLALLLLANDAKNKTSRHLDHSVCSIWNSLTAMTLSTGTGTTSSPSQVLLIIWVFLFDGAYFLWNRLICCNPPPPGIVVEMMHAALVPFLLPLGRTSSSVSRGDIGCIFMGWRGIILLLEWPYCAGNKSTQWCGGLHFLGLHVVSQWCYYNAYGGTVLTGTILHIMYL